MANALDWPQKNDHAIAAVDAPSIVSAYSHTSQKPSTGLSGSEQQGQAMESALDWMRDNSMLPGDLDDPSIVSYGNVGGSDIAAVQQNAQDMANTLEW